MQKKEQIKPLFLNMDKSFEELAPHETPFLKGLTFDVNKNPVSNIGANNPSGIGQNQLKQTTIRSNVPVPDVMLPEGYNKHIGCYESVTTHEQYEFKYNSNGNHGIYVYSGDTGIWQKVVIDPELGFTDDQENFIANHRVSLRFIRGSKGEIIEKFLLITDGNTWHKYINVLAAINTNGFDKALYPYWNLKPPHFDRRELLEWPVRPPMIRPIIKAIPNSTDDKGKMNRFIDKGIQVAIAFQNTDGRPSTLSPYSLPFLTKSEDYLNNPDNIPKNAKAILYAGSPLTEKILFYVRSAKAGTNTLPNIKEWSDWFLYDTIKKFTDSNSNNVLGTDYWLRENPFAGYNYDNIFNTIEYVFDLSKVQQIVNQDDANMIQTEQPQLSIAMCDLGDAALLGDNRYGYPNFGDDILSKFHVFIAEKERSACVLQLRNIRLYAYIARPGDDAVYTSQVGYVWGEDPKIRFGGLWEGTSFGGNTEARLIKEESEMFALDFADKKAFRCYLKGTPYYADGKWYKVNSDNSLTELTDTFDFSTSIGRTQAQDIFLQQGYFVCVFDISAPAGKYIATLGRHNVESSGDYRNKSTYIYGIANSRAKQQVQVQHLDGSNISYTTLTTIKPNAINNGNGILYSKEMEIDCTNGDVDVWGNNHDLFYVFCPYIRKVGNERYRFIEGYLEEDKENMLPVEMFPYKLTEAADDWGQFTDKNGFYWGFTFSQFSNTTDIQFVTKLNCAYPINFTISTSIYGTGWRPNPVAYLEDYNGGVVGAANRILYKGKITSIDGTLNYSNISISIKDGDTVYTNPNGEFTLIIHNGLPVLRSSNVYLNAGGSFSVTIENCGQLPLYNFNEANVACIYPVPVNQERIYPVPLNVGVNISTDSETSTKEGGKYNVSIHGADLAGRITYENIISEVTVPSFLERDNVNATFFRLLIDSGFDFDAYPDIKWMAISVSRNVNVKRYVQWVGDAIQYFDNNGVVVTDPASAVVVGIKLNSLLNANVSKNLSLLSSYQFVKNDRIRVLDDGDGNLLNTATYGDPIDLQILGTNYTQAAINAGILTPETNTIISDPTATDVSLIVRYDSRLDVLKDKNGFWIEIYTPTEQSDIIPFYEVQGFYPIINGSIAEFTGYNSGTPIYTYLSSIDIDFWDTYLFDRNITIPDVGNKYFSHPFESPNVTDNWGANVISGGRIWIKNDNARQYWLPGETIKSDDFLKEGIVNGLATFRSGNKKDFGSFPYGGITAMISERNIVAYICENDWFITDYNYHYAFVNEQGIMQANLDNGLSAPHQKVGSKFGLSKNDTATFISYDKEIYWYDRKNTAWVRCNFRDAMDTSIKSEAEQGGVQSYISAKTDFITTWNNTHNKESCFDVVAGVDIELGKIYLTFRCRRNNSNDPSSYINDKRNWQLNFQETLVYDTINRGWLRSEGFAPEGYGTLRGNYTSTQLISFAAGKPYLHKTGNDGFNKFYGIQTTPSFMGVLNSDNGIIKAYEAMYYSGNPSGWFVDYIFTDFKNSLSWISYNQFRNYFGNYYAPILRNANSYPNNSPEDLFRCMLADGYKMRGHYLVFRMVGDYNSLNDYKEVGTITGLITMDESNKK